MGQAPWRVLRVGERTHPALERVGQPGRPAAVGGSATSSRRSSAKAYADWMLRYSRNLCDDPNVYIMDQFGSQIRHFNPVSVDKTEVTIYCIAPKGESAEVAKGAHSPVRTTLFNASGMATPDDLEEFRSCQKTYLATAAPWNDMSRGAKPLDRRRRTRRPRHSAWNPASSGVKTEDEGLFIVLARLRKKALKAGARHRGGERGQGPVRGRWPGPRLQLIPSRHVSAIPSKERPHGYLG